MHRDNTLNLPKTGQKKENPFKGNIGHSLSPPRPGPAFGLDPSCSRQPGAVAVMPR